MTLLIEITRVTKNRYDIWLFPIDLYKDTIKSYLQELIQSTSLDKKSQIEWMYHLAYNLWRDGKIEESLKEC